MENQIGIRAFWCYVLSVVAGCSPLVSLVDIYNYMYMYINVYVDYKVSSVIHRMKA